MPVEILTREEIELVVEEKLKKLMTGRSPTLEDVELKKRVMALESSLVELEEKVASLSASLTGLKPAGADPFLGTLKGDLGELGELLEIKVEGNLVIIRPKRYLGSQRFRTVIEIVRKHGGNWASDRRAFIIRRRQ